MSDFIFCLFCFFLLFFCNCTSGIKIAAASSLVEKEDWEKTVKANYLRIAETWVTRDYDFVKRIIPVIPGM